MTSLKTICTQNSPMDSSILMSDFVPYLFWVVYVFGWVEVVGVEVVKMQVLQQRLSEVSIRSSGLLWKGRKNPVGHVPKILHIIIRTFFMPNFSSTLCSLSDTQFAKSDGLAH